MATDQRTRENCNRCGRRGFGFIVPKPLWLAVAGARWEHAKLCIVCFADLGDEKNIQWEDGLEVQLVSIASQHRYLSEGGDGTAPRGMTCATHGDDWEYDGDCCNDGWHAEEDGLCRKEGSDDGR